jgi:putative glutamine amidotransferase
MQPLIGVTCSSDPDGNPRINPRYVRAIHVAGGLPVPLPWIASEDEAHAVLERLAGMVFTGSEDIDPGLWGEDLHEKTVLMHPHRMATEIHMSRAVLDRGTPTLAVCGGMQSLNAVAGGSLHQHIPDAGGDWLDHSDTDPEMSMRHEVEASAGSRLAELCGRAFATNTQHHQAIHRLADGFVPTAWSGDGCVEAFEGAGDDFMVAVQWHPERMLEQPGQLALFSSLTTVARKARS